MEQVNTTNNIAVTTIGLLAGCAAVAIAVQVLPFVLLGFAIDALASKQTKEQN
jgi:hypothetical protein